MQVKVGDLMVAQCIRVTENDKISKAMRKVAEDREAMVVCVVDESDKLVGIITPKRLLKTVQLAAFRDTRDPSFEWGEVLSSLTTKYARDIMGPPVSLTPDDNITDAIDLMLDKNLYDLPVVNKNGEVVGVIYFYDIIANWVKKARKIRGSTTTINIQHEHWHSM